MGCRLCVLACLMLVAHGARAERLPMSAYTAAHGLAHVRVAHIAADSRGFVWFCGPDGLSRFDGQGFTRYGDGHGLANTRINDFLETSRGVYWVATNGGGVYRYTPLLQRPGEPNGSGSDAARFTPFRVGDDLQTNRVNALFEDRQGRLWAGTDGGLFQLDDSTSPAAFRRVAMGVPANPDRAVQIWAFAEDRAGGLWIGTSRGLLRRHADGRIIHSRVQPGRGLDHVRALLVDRDGRIWIGHDTGLIVSRPDDRPLRVPNTTNRSPTSALPRASLPAVPGEVSRYTVADGVSAGMVRAFLQTADGHVWIGTRDGLTVFDGRQFRSFTSAQGISRVTALAEGREGSIWIGTLTHGARRLARTGFTGYTEADGLSDTLIGRIFETPDGLYAVASNQRIHRLVGTRFVAVRPNFSKDGADPVGPGIALRDRAGEWWIPGVAGLYRFPSVTRVEQLAHVPPKATYTARDGLAGDDVFRLFEDSRGDIWIGRRIPTSSVVTRWERATGTFHRYTDADGLPPFNRIYAFAEDRSGNIWMGFQNGGLARFRQGRFAVYTADDGAPAEGIGGLFVDARGRLWIGAKRPALTRVDDPSAERPRFVHYSSADGVSAEYVGPIVEDRAGRLYLGTSGRVDRFDPETGMLRHFTAADGLPRTDLTTAFRDKSGAIWFASYDGLFRLVPGDDAPRPRPAVRIGGVRVAGASYMASDLGETDVPRFELGPALNQLQIEFFALGAGSSDTIRYQYRLEGADNDWNAPTDRRDVNYASLSPGEYRFIVRAVADDGAPSTEVATVAFAILPPLWHRWWFRGTVVLAAVLAVLAAHRYRVRHLLALERVRMRIAADLHDDIGGSLSRISIQSEVACREAAALGAQPVRRLADIAESARGVLDALGDVVWSIDPRRDDLASVFRRIREYGDDLFAGNGARWTYHSAGGLDGVKLDPQARRNLFLLVKEAITNVARHASARSVSLHVDLSGRELRVDLHDDGRGFVPEQHADGGDRHGIASMRARADQLGALLSIVSLPSTGTTVSLRAPLRARRRMTMLLSRRLR